MPQRVGGSRRFPAYQVVTASGFHVASGITHRPDAIMVAAAPTLVALLREEGRWQVADWSAPATSRAFSQWYAGWSLRVDRLLSKMVPRRPR